MQFNIIRLVTIVSLVARLCRAAAAVLGVLYGTISENNVHVQKHITWGSGDTSTPSAIPDSISNIIFFIISSGKQQLPSCRTREIPIPFMQRNGMGKALQMYRSPWVVVEWQNQICGKFYDQDKTAMATKQRDNIQVRQSSSLVSLKFRLSANLSFSILQIQRPCRLGWLKHGS